MPRKIELPATKRHLHINDEDWDFLYARFGPEGANPTGVAVVIRAIIHKRVQELRAREAALADAPLPVAPRAVEDSAEELGLA